MSGSDLGYHNSSTSYVFTLLQFTPYLPAWLSLFVNYPTAAAAADNNNNNNNNGNGHSNILYFT